MDQRKWFIVYGAIKRSSEGVVIAGNSSRFLLKMYYDRQKAWRTFKKQGRMLITLSLLWLPKVTLDLTFYLIFNCASSLSAYGCCQCRNRHRTSRSYLLISVAGYPARRVQALGSPDVRAIHCRPYRPLHTTCSAAHRVMTSPHRPSPRVLCLFYRYCYYSLYGRHRGWYSHGDSSNCSLPFSLEMYRVLPSGTFFSVLRDHSNTRKDNATSLSCRLTVWTPIYPWTRNSPFCTF